MGVGNMLPEGDGVFIKGGSFPHNRVTGPKMLH